ncbi:MAG TPA: amino acid permease [Phycisphaerae bacterium]|nr:amino acid permease [Phycisphaerae bacterium]
MGLEKKLGFLDVFCLASGAMISSGLFVLPGQAYMAAGPAVVLAYAIAGLIMIPALLSQCELATAMPKSGGSYFFVERSMGALPGTFAGLAGWVCLALKSAFAMIGIGAFARLIWPDAPLDAGQWEWLIKIIAVTFCVIFAAMNCISVKMASWTQLVMVFGLLGVLAIFIILGFPAVNQHPNFDHFTAKGFGNILATAGLVFISYGGLTKAANVAEEVRRPGRNLPRAMLTAFWVVTILYVLTVFVVVGTLSSNKLAGEGQVNLTPVSSAAETFMGPAGVILLSVAAILAFVTTGNGGILAASRYPLAMSRDGILPQWMQRVSHRFGTPWVSVLLTAGFMIVTILMLSIEELVKSASTMLLLLFVLINISVLIMRSSRIQNYRPRYLSPFYPWVQIAGVIIYVVIIVQLTAEFGLEPLMTVAAFVIFGVLWYWFYVRPRSTRQSALYYMVQRIVSPSIRRAGLEQELRTIATQRDDIVHDRFDMLIEKCAILDLQGPISRDELFSKAAAVLSGRLGMAGDEIKRRLEKREEMSSTMIHPGLAIPHIIIDGEKQFDILLVRCRQGVVFDAEQPYVKMIFILVGSADERNYHLRALMAIANIVEEQEFVHNWLEAEDIEHLRDLILLSNRNRGA